MKTQITKQLSNAVTARTETSTKTRDRLSLFTLTLLALSLTFGAASATPAAAGVLDSSTVVQLSLPNCATNCGNSSPGIFPTINNTGGAFTGAWPSNVAAGWQGSFSGNGTYPVKEPGTNTFDFSGLGGANHDLPAGSLIFLGDLDAGSGGGESFSFTALDSSGNAITGVSWLNSPFYVSGADSSQFTLGSMPEYSWNSATGTYKFDGDNVAGNPTIGVWLTTNTAISGLSVDSTTAFASYAVAAPVPEPGSLLLLGSGLLGLAGMARRKLIG